MFTILQVEDTPTDVMLTAQALDKCDVPVQIHVTKDGREAIKFLNHELEYPDAPRPDLILLDLNMPVMDGFEVLKTIKKDADLLAIPVVVFSTLTAPTHREKAFSLHANSVVTKPIEHQEFKETVQCIARYWARTCAGVR